MSDLPRRRRPPVRAAWRRRKSATPLRVQPAQTMLVAMADSSPRPGKWYRNDESTTTGEHLTTSPCGGNSPLSVESPDEVSARQRIVCSSVRSKPESAADEGFTQKANNAWWRPAALLSSVLLFVVRRLGFGRAPEACLTWRQHIWFLTNRPMLDKALARLQACPKLAALGETGSIWDAFQVFMVVATRGSIYAERHGALTGDGHLLIVHRLRKVPSNVRKQLRTMEDASLLGLIWSRVRGGDGGALRTNEFVEVPPGKQVVIFQHGLLESSINWVTSATLLPDPLTIRCYRAVSTEAAALRRLLLDGCPYTQRGERLPDLQRMSASLPLALLLSDCDLPGAARQCSSLVECLRAIQPLERMQSEEMLDDCQSLFDIWLSNSRGNFFTARLDNTQPYEPPLGHKPLCSETFRRLSEIYEEEWTHFDMAGEDIEAVYRTIYACVHPTDTLRPICVGFSQGASILLMNAHGRLSRMNGNADQCPFDSDLVPLKPRGYILLCPPVVLKAQEMFPKFESSLDFTLKDIFCWDRVVAILVNLGVKRMDILGMVVEPVLSLAPANSLRFADIFVQRALRFYHGRVDGRGHLWSYKMTPNGLTSGRNIACFRRCIKGASDYVDGLETIAAQALPSLGKLCPAHIFLALDDNIASSSKHGVTQDSCIQPAADSLEAIRARCPQAKRRLLDLSGRLKWSDPAGDDAADLVVSMVEGHAHLDMTWTSGRREVLHQHIFATIKYLLSRDPLQDS